MAGERKTRGGDETGFESNHMGAFRFLIYIAYKSAMPVSSENYRSLCAFLISVLFMALRMGGVKHTGHCPTSTSTSRKSLCSARSFMFVRVSRFEFALASGLVNCSFLKPRTSLEPVNRLYRHLGGAGYQGAHSAPSPPVSPPTPPPPWLESSPSAPIKALTYRWASGEITAAHVVACE